MMNYDEQLSWLRTTEAVLAELPYMTDLELALTYAAYLDNLEGDGFFIQEMQDRGLEFTDLEQLLIQHEEDHHDPCCCDTSCPRCGGSCNGPERCPCKVHNS